MIETANPVTCKKCGTANLNWWFGYEGWVLVSYLDRKQHTCEGGEVNLVKCKYCPANDLHWMKETMPDGQIKSVLTESYGLPHECDERKQFIEKQKQDKKDLYAKEKARLELLKDLHPDVKKKQLAILRMKLWPRMAGRR